VNIVEMRHKVFPILGGLLRRVTEHGVHGTKSEMHHTCYPTTTFIYMQCMYYDQNYCT